MTAQSYVIRADHVRVAVDTANDDDRRRLLDILELVGELDELERTLPDRVAAAQATAEEPPLSLSKSAMEAASQSDDAAREIDRLLTRKCNRADSAVAVVKEILAIAKLDAKESKVFLNWIDDDDPTKPIHAELCDRKKVLVESLRRFVADHGL